MGIISQRVRRSQGKGKGEPLRRKVGRAAMRRMNEYPARQVFKGKAGICSKEVCRATS